MEWREQSAVSCDEAYLEAQKWIEAVTKKKFGSNDFRSALENGVLLCDLINKIKPGVIRKINRLPTPIAGLDNLNVFLKACGKLGLKEAQLFHPGDLQDLSSRVTVKDQETNRRLKNVLITIYWLGRRAQSDRFYDGPYLNFKSFEGLLGTALYKALHESPNQKGSNIRDSGFGDSWYSEREELHQLREEEGGRRRGGGHRRDDSLDSLDSLGSRPHSISSDTTLKGSSEGCCSDTEVDSVFKMAENKDSASYRRSVSITPKATAPFNQFLPTKDKQAAYVPAPLRKKRADRNEDNRRSWTNPSYSEEEGTLTRPSPDWYDNSQVSQSASPAAHLQWAYEYESGSDSDTDRPDPDLVLDDLASRRFHSPSPATPTNFAVPISPVAGRSASGGRGGPWPKVTMSPNVVPQQNVTFLRSENMKRQLDHRRAVSADSLFRDIYDDSEDEDNEVGYADPVQDDLYARKMGIKPQNPASVSHDKFLPKFWTPEEDVHIQKIKLGSQRRPWYKKMQGFSYKKSGSSSDDSDYDISPWLSSAPSPSSTSPSHPHTHEASAHTTLVPPLLQPPPLIFPPVDPTSGPRLVKCERWPLLGRQDPREPPDPVDYDSIIPDLENDDMFTRRTLAFQSNTDLVTMKTQLSAHRPLYTSEPQLNIITQRHTNISTEESDFPDIEQDDVVHRREKTQQAQEQRPLSGAPDNYTPMPIPEPWALPPDLKARLLCPPCPLTKETTGSKQVEKETRPKTDDMLIRKLGVCSEQSTLRGSAANQMTPSVPSSCSEGDLQKWQAIREASRLRYKKKLLVERLSALKSKSTSDILADPSVVRQARFEELQKYREQIKESEDKWQDDLSKWKSRRRSVNSDIVKKKEEREKFEQSTGSNSNRRSKTFKEMQEERENKGNSVGSRLRSLSYLDDEDVFEKPVTSPRTRTLPARSYTIDTPLYSSEPSLKEEEPPAAFPAIGRADSPPTSRAIDIVDSPAGSDSTTTTIYSTSVSSITPSAVHRSPSPAAAPPRKSAVTEFTSTVKTEDTTTVLPSSRSTPKVPEPRRPLLVPQTAVEAPSSGSLYKRQPQISSMEPKPPGASRVSASLPRSYQRSDSARITSVVTPRPFGTQSSRITSLPRAHTMDEPQKRVNGDVDVSKKSSVPSRYHQFMTSEDENQSQSSSAHSSEDEEEEEEEMKSAPKSITSIQSVSPDPPRVKSVSPVAPPVRSVSPVAPPFKSEAPVSPAAAKESSQENYCEMRISLNQKPNSSRDFGFQTAWDSTGARVTSVQPGSSAEMCQLQVGDEILTVNQHQVADMSYRNWMSCMEEALQEGSLVMDIRRHGKNSSPDTNIVNPSLDFTSRISPEKLSSKETPVHSVIDVASNGVNGGFREASVTMRNKESEPISLKNLKRRSEFFEQGGSEAVMPDIPVPAITPSSRWSWDPEEERRRQEKWQKEQERLLQEKYKRDQEKLQEEWERAQEEISKSRGQLQQPEVNSRSLSPHPPASHAISPPWEEEERKRKEEQERQRQAEERRKREEEELELQRLQEERMRREREAEEERKRREEELREQRRREEEREEERRRQEALEQQRRERERERERALELQQQQQQQQWAKSKSSSQLDEEERLQRRVTGSGALDRKGQQPSSQAEAERQQILNEMKKKTPLLTDGSWIRQRASEPPANRDPDMPPMRRGESLDNLDSSYNSWRSSWTPRSSSSIPNYTRPNSALSGSTNFNQGWSGAQRPLSSTLPSSYSMGSLRGGAGTPSAPWSRQSNSPYLSSPSPTTSPEPTSEGGALQQKSRSVSGKKICTFCDTPLGKGAAMIIESLGLCYHLGCFKCIDCKSDLGGSEAGAEVRIRNKQLYCNSCYMRFKSGQPTAM
ncbi:LIM domain only protein 7 isoform X17 [Xyrichtys novacula]|uniref:LIM domain only protein 7 isoform X17 n=1 Tax=Xyrichtys novacula TaxID=13765 RepID=A0AAV1H142_XYRNO|nr:LIM domain only protein 7 isoform X17 [Xyrichtys novacula]